MRKKWISAGLVLVLLLMMMPTTFKAADTAPKITWNCVKNGSKKNNYLMRGHLKMDCGVRSITTVLNFDGSVIQPVAGPRWKDFPYTDGAAEVGNTVSERLTYKKTPAENRTYFAEAQVRTSGNRVELRYTQSAAENYPAPVNLVYMEFYFRLADGKSWHDANSGTFMLQAIDGIEPGIIIQDTNDNLWYFGGSSAPLGGSPIPAENAAVNYQNNTVPSPDCAPESPAASMEGQSFRTLQAAVDAMTRPDSTVRLERDLTETVEIPENRSIRLELAGHTLTGREKLPTVSCGGTLTVSDSVGVGGIIGTEREAVCLVGQGSLTLESGIAETKSPAGTAIVNRGVGTVCILDGTILGGALAVDGKAHLSGGYYRARETVPCAGEVTFAEGVVMSAAPLDEGAQRGLYFVGRPEEIRWLDGDGSVLAVTHAAYGTPGGELIPPEGVTPHKQGENGTAYTFTHWLLPERVRTNTQVLPAFQEVRPEIQCSIWIEAPACGDVGTELHADILVSARDAVKLRDVGFTLEYNEKALRLADIVPAPGLRKEKLNHGSFTASAENPDGFSVSADGVKLAEAVFRVQQPGGTDLGFLPDNLYLHAAEDIPAVLTAGRAAHVDTWDIRIQLKPGIGCTINGTNRPVVLYARYGQPGVYVNSGRTVPAEPQAAAQAGYRLLDPLWSDGQRAYTMEELLREAIFEKNTSLTAQTTKVYTVAFISAVGGSLAGGAITAEFDVGTPFEMIHPPVPVPDKGYRFVAWHVLRSSTGKAYEGTKVNSSLTWVAQFTRDTFTVTWPQGAEGPDRADGSEDFAFTPSLPGKIVTGVKVTIGGVPFAGVAEERGQYIIPRSAIVGNIQLEFISVDGCWTFVEGGVYGALEPGRKLAILDLPGRESYALEGGGEMFWSDLYGGLVSIVDEKETEASLAQKLIPAAGNKALSYDGNLNGSMGADGRPELTAADAMPVRAILQGTEPLGYHIDDRMRLEMDVTGDRAVTAEDIQWILDRAAG